MIIDVNAHLGHYPFRRLRRNDARSLVDHMDAHSIDLALVSSLPAVFYRDTQEGNRELFDEIEPFRLRLVPIATVNPKYVGWERDLAESVQRGAKGITLVPEHHGYLLSDEYGHAAMQRIAELDLPVVLTQRFEDRRQRHHWDVANDLTAATLIEAAGAHPTLRFLLSNWAGLDGEQLRAAGLRGRCLIDFARLHVLMNKEVPGLIETLGVEAIAYGSHMPFDYLGPSLVKLANVAALLPDDYERIAWRNAAEFFDLKLSDEGADQAETKP
ncbi:MAG: amidohydrolase family protein [Planctomycetaceae bacterium]|nr:amidohydrolase family protein [Planctomycetaceae bacterium]